MWFGFTFISLDLTLLPPRKWLRQRKSRRYNNILYMKWIYTKDHIAQNESKIEKKNEKKKYKNFPLWHVRLTHNQHIRAILLTQLKHSHTCRPNKTLLSIVINKIPCPVVYRAAVYLCSYAIRQIDIYLFLSLVICPPTSITNEQRVR